MEAGTFYSEWDPYSAAWIRNLVRDGLVSPGVVDERDVREVKADEVRGYHRQHYFAGVCGWELALQLAGWDADRPVWSGSAPCPSFSTAGRKKCKQCNGRVGFVGDEFGCLSCPWRDERHLWPAFRDLIAELRPPTVFGEQVASADGRVWLSRVRDDLEHLGYAVGAADLCASSVGAPHLRQRLFWAASLRPAGCDEPVKVIEAVARPAQGLLF